MKLATSLLVTCLIAGVIWLGLIFQPASTPTEFEKYSTMRMDYTTMAEAGYAMVLYGREVAAEYFELDDYKALSTVSSAVAGTLPVKMVKSETMEKAEVIDVEQPREFITGFSKVINLLSIGDLWVEFIGKNELSDQLKSENFTIYVVYTDFNRELTASRVSIGYLDSSMKGERIALPQGTKTPLLPKGDYTPTAIASAWSRIDLQKPVKAVLERHDYQGDQATVSSFVIYQ